MSIDARFRSADRDEPEPRLALENPPPGPATAVQSIAPADPKPAVFQVSAADVLPAAAPALPRLQTFEELGLPDQFKKAVEEELDRDEKLVWLGRPSRNPAVEPPKTPLVVAGAVCLGLAVLLPLLVHGIPFIFPGALALFGLLFVLAPTLLKGKSGYSACYVVTNRRAMLLEKGIIGLDPRTIKSWKSLTGVRCKSYYPHELLSMERRDNERVPGAGDLIFEYIFAIGRGVQAFPGTNGTVQRTDVPQRVPRGFFFLEQAAEVEHLIRTTLLTNLEKSLDERLAAPAAKATPVREERAALLTAACGCGAILQAPEALAGQSVKCPQCGAALRVGSRDASPTADAPAEPCREDGPVPADLKAKLVAELGTGERLVWVGQPVPAVVFRRGLHYLGGGVLLAAIALFWVAFGFLGQTAAKKGAAAPQAKAPAATQSPSSIPLLLLAGAVGCAAVPFYQWKMAQRTGYALTNRRAVVFRQGLFGPHRESYSPAEVAKMQRRDCWLSPGAGDLIFHTVVIIRNSYSRQMGSRRSVTTKHYGFLAIPRVAELEKLVRETLINPFVDRLQAANSW